MGYIEETGVAQHYRDARIAPIYEGTNGIQAIDLVGPQAAVRHGLAGEELASIRTHLTDALDVLAETTEWLLSQRDDVQDVFAGATPFLRLMATVVGGAFMARSAQVALELRDDAAGEERDFLDAKLVTARFYAEQVLPQVHGLKHQVTATARDLFALSPAQLGL
jgi:3-(methylthio)propanoyl-CoA dehydrogenase